MTSIIMRSASYIGFSLTAVVETFTGIEGVLTGWWDPLLVYHMIAAAI